MSEKHHIGPSGVPAGLEGASGHAGRPSGSEFRPWAREERRQVLLTGVGGQGVLTAARLLGEAASSSGLAVRVGQLHGMSQRGGSVECPVLFGPGHSTALIGKIDLLAAFEPLEALRWVALVGPQTTVVINRGVIVPFAMVASGRTYPARDETIAQLEQGARRVVLVDGSRIVEEAGDVRTLNVAMLGAVSGLGLLPFAPETVWARIAATCPANSVEANRRAFQSGLGAVSG